MTHWQEWHRGYDDAASHLPRRLAVVQQRCREALQALARPARVLSLCAGDGRDLLPVLAELPDLWRSAVLVELDPELSAAAARTALPGTEIVHGDAGVTATFAHALPADLLLLCGIFGNVPADDVRRTLDAVPALVAPGGFVIWTRGASEPDQREAVRGWAREAGLQEVAWSGSPEPFSVGLAQRPVELAEAELPERLFAFA